VLKNFHFLLSVFSQCLIIIAFVYFESVIIYAIFAMSKVAVPNRY